MIDRIKINTLGEYIGQSVTIAGFAQAIRAQSKIAFIVLRDISGTVQVVVLPEVADTFSTAAELSLESVISVSGIVKSEEQAPGGIEIQATAISVLSVADPELPIPVVAQKGADEVHINNRLDYRWIDLRRDENKDLFRVWTALERGARNFFHNDGWTQIYTPALMGTASESGAEVFQLPYFETNAYLAQSPQFYKQMALASGLEKVFMVGPLFRAENSFTTRHLTEFTGWDFEMAYIDSHHDLMDAEEQMIVSAFTELRDSGILPGLAVPSRPFPRITMSEAKTKLSDLGIENTEEYDLNPEEERELSRIVQEETGHEFVFVIDFHISKRPFYHMRHDDNPNLTKSADLLFRGIEITTLAQREHRLPILQKQAQEKEMDLSALADYFDFFRYGCPPHGGGGIGPTRIVMKLLGFENVREACFLPRDVKRLRP